MQNDIYIGFDLGTSSIKVGAFDLNGNELGLVAHSTPKMEKQTDAREFDGNEFQKIALNSLQELLELKNVNRQKVKGIAIASQAQTFLISDSSGNLLRPAISWLDRRGIQNLHLVNEILASQNLPQAEALSSIFSILWLKKNEPLIYKRIKKLFLLGSYLTWVLTGQNISEIRAAESTGFYIKNSNKWNKELVDLCGLDYNCLPQVKMPGQTAGNLQTQLCERFGLNTDVKVAAGVHDQMATAIGLGNVFPGCISISLGTATAAVGSSAEKPAEIEGVSQRQHPVPSLYASLCFTKEAGIAIQNFCNRENIKSKSPNLFDDIINVENRELNGSMKTEAFKHLMDIANEVKIILYKLKQAIGSVNSVRIGGGGARSNSLMYLIAKQTDSVVQRSNLKEPGCLGAAMLAMANSNKAMQLQDVGNKIYQPEKTFEPNKVLIKGSNIYTS